VAQAPSPKTLTHIYLAWGKQKNRKKTKTIFFYILLANSFLEIHGVTAHEAIVGIHKYKKKLA
jgi:hypothetical protein